MWRKGGTEAVDRVATLVYFLGDEVIRRWSTKHCRDIVWHIWLIYATYHKTMSPRVLLHHRHYKCFFLPLPAEPAGDDVKFKNTGNHKSTSDGNQDGAQQLCPLKPGVVLVVSPAHRSESCTHQSKDDSREQQGSSGLLTIQHSVRLKRIWARGSHVSRVTLRHIYGCCGAVVLHGRPLAPNVSPKTLMTLLIHDQTESHATSDRKHKLKERALSVKTYQLRERTSYKLTWILLAWCTSTDHQVHRVCVWPFTHMWAHTTVGRLVMAHYNTQVFRFRKTHNTV